MPDWPSLFEGAPRPKDVHYLGIPGSVEGGTTTFLAFGDGQAEPLFCVKVHRTEGAEARVEEEARMLKFLEDLGLSDSIPRVITHGGIAGTAYIVSTIVAGHPMPIRLGPEGFPVIETAKSDFQRSFLWLEELHGALQARGALPPPAFAEWRRLREEFVGIFSPTESESAFLDLIEHALASVREGFLQHGDYCRHNLLVTAIPGDGSPRVIDWTDSRKPGWPLHDQFFFSATYFLQVRRRPGLSGLLRAFDDTFFANNPYGRLVRGAILASARALGIRSGLIGLFGAFLVERVLFERRQVLACQDRGGLPRFASYLASMSNLPFDEAANAQLWIHFFRRAAKMRRLLCDESGWKD